MILLGERNHYSLVEKDSVVNPSAYSTMYAKALRRAIRHPHVAPEVPYLCAIVHAGGGAGSNLENRQNTYGPLLFAEVLLIQPNHLYDACRRADIHLLSSCELHVLPQGKAVDSVTSRDKLGACVRWQKNLNGLDCPLSTHCSGTLPH